MAANFVRIHEKKAFQLVQVVVRIKINILWRRSCFEVFIYWRFISTPFFSFSKTLIYITNCQTPFCFVKNAINFFKYAFLSMLSTAHVPIFRFKYSHVMIYTVWKNENEFTFCYNKRTTTTKKIIAQMHIHLFLYWKLQNGNGIVGSMGMGKM